MQNLLLTCRLLVTFATEETTKKMESTPPQRFSVGFLTEDAQTVRVVPERRWIARSGREPEYLRFGFENI